MRGTPLSLGPRYMSQYSANDLMGSRVPFRYTFTLDNGRHGAAQPRIQREGGVFALLEPQVHIKGVRKGHSGQTRFPQVPLQS
jgi:hypothetical protein